MAYTKSLIIQIDLYGNCSSTDSQPSIATPTATATSGTFSNVTLDSIFTAGWNIVGAVPGSSTPIIAIIAHT